MNADQRRRLPHARPWRGLHPCLDPVGNTRCRWLGHRQSAHSAAGLGSCQELDCASTASHESRPRR